MPLTFEVDKKNRLVIARATGTLTLEDLFRYQFEAWSRKELREYDELVDLTKAQEFTPASADRIKDLSNLAAAMESNGIATKLAIVAKGDFDFGLARMFQVFRELHPQSKKQVAVFRSADEALTFLGANKG